MTKPYFPSERGLLLDMRATAKRCLMSISNLRLLMLKGAGPPGFKRPASNRWYFWEKEVDAWLESGRVTRNTRLDRAGRIIAENQEA